MDDKKKIEIPFGAFDSELVHQEINIPNGFKAVIDGNKIILTRIESEDEKVRKALVEMVHDTTGDELWVDYNVHKEEALAWLEKQGKSSDQIHYWTEEEIEPIISDYLRGAEHYGGMIGRLRCLKPKSLEKQSETYTKRDVDNAWLEGMASAKRELEKQGEQKPTDKVEPKFKVGDWVVYYRNDSSREVLQVYDIRDGRYYFTDNVHFSWSVKECDEKSHLWTIEDARGGDVLVFKNNIGGIIICKSPTYYDTRSYCRLVSDNLINKEESGWDSTLLVPATNEQCDTLMKAMADAGYTFDFAKKELKKIEQKPWSKEDDVRLQACIDTLQAESLMGKVDTVMTNWLKSLKDRYTWKPSDAQMASITCAVRKMKESACYDSELVSLLNDLKKLREE